MPTDSEYRNCLRNCLGTGEGTNWEIRDNDGVDRETNGAWVQLWFFVSNEEVYD